MRMKSLPRFGIKIIVCYEDRKWGEDVFLDLLELHKSCPLLRYSQHSERAEFTDRIILQLVKHGQYGFLGE